MKQLHHTNLIICIGILCCSSLAMHAQTLRHRFSKKDSLKIETEAAELIRTPEPVFKPFQMPKMDSTQLADLGFEQVYKSEPVRFRVRDGKYLAGHQFTGNSNTTIILLHGVLSSSFTMNRMAGLLQAVTNANVVAIDLRGHGESAGTPGDVDYIDQYADDLTDVIRLLRKQRPTGRILVTAHSMGGGIALRQAMKDHSGNISGYILFAPLLGQNAPTLPKVSADTGAAANFVQLDLKRVIGLKMYNGIGIHRYDYLPVLFFNLPKGAPFNKYSYRSDISMSPDDFKAGLHSVKVPLLTIVGSKDEAFEVQEFKPAVENNSRGHVIIINGATHDGVRHSPAAMDSVKAWYHQNLFDKNEPKPGY